MKQLEEWTKKKCSELLFDSTVDNWSYNTSVFDSKLMNKSNLIFIVEDTDNNKFGYYFNGTLTNNGCFKCSGSFMFTLKANNRNSGMYKFEQKETSTGLCVSDKSHSWFLHIHAGFIMYKANSHEKQYIAEWTDHFDFHGMTNVYFANSTGTSHKYFTPKRITVVQMK